MRVQRNNQLLRELEGEPDILDMHDEPETAYVSRVNSHKKGPAKLMVIPVTEEEFLGPDYCLKKPIFLPHHFPELKNKGPLIG